MERPLEDRVRLLHLLLSQHPEARLSAHSTDGLPMPVPAAIPKLPTQTCGSTISVRAWAPEDRTAVVRAFAIARSEGMSTVPARLAHDHAVTCTLHLFDVVAIYGAVITVAIGNVLDAQLRGLADADADGTAPRLTRMRMSDLGIILSIDEAATAILGWSPEEMVGRGSLDFVHPEDHGIAVETWFEVLVTPNTARRVRQRCKTRDGGWVWFEIMNTNLLATKEGCIEAEMVDISAEMAAQELLVQLTQAIPLGVLQLDTHRRVTYRNHQLLAMLHLSDLQTLDDLSALVMDSAKAELLRAIDEVLGSTIGDKTLELELELKLMSTTSRRTGHFQLTLRQLSRQRGDASGAVVCLADITNAVLLRRELAFRATRDPLTDCLNRHAANTGLETLLGDESTRGVAVCFVDLDDFKTINDTWGHAAGDEVLIAVARQLQGAVRGRDFLGRIGGDEFLVVFADVPSAATAYELARRVALLISQTAVKVVDLQVPVRASVGVAWSTAEGIDRAATLIKQADHAMYLSKREGRGLVHRWTHKAETHRLASIGSAHD